MSENYIYHIRQEVLREEAANIWGGLLMFMSRHDIPYLPKDANEHAAVLWALAEIRDGVISDKNNNFEMLDSISARLTVLEERAAALSV